MNNDFLVNNNKEFVEFARHQKIATNETIVSFDVASLFTSIPVQFALDIIERKLHERDQWMRHTNLQETQIIKLLKFVLNITAALNSVGHTTIKFPGVLWGLLLAP